MAFKRIFAILLGMIMTVEAVPAVVFAKEMDFAANRAISAEEESAEETEQTKESKETKETKETHAPAKETEARKDIAEPTEEKPDAGESKEDSEGKEKDSSDGSDKKEAEKEDKEPSGTEEKEPEQTEEEKPDQTEAKETEQTGDKKPEASEPKETEQTEEEVPSETNSEEDHGTVESEPSATDKGNEEGNDDQKPADAGVEEDPVLKDGEIIIEKDGVPYETHYFTGSQDKEKQFEEFFKKKARDLINNRKLLRRAAPAGGSNLSGQDLIAYKAFKSGAADVANGVSTSTRIEAPISDFNLSTTSWTAKQLGISDLLTVNAEGEKVVNPTAAAIVRSIVNIKISISAVDNALLADCPYELYWFDKTKGVRLFNVRVGVKTINGELRAFISNGPTADFCVSRDYCDDSKIEKDGRVYVTDPAKISKVNAAVSNAAKIVNDAKSKSDYEKLVYYYQQICSRVMYDHSAAGTGDVNYGDPWQIISVFDGNTSTNVVCEGYAKAFMYLCDLTSFEGDISCITVTGDIREGGHMWNIVNMDNGLNYHVDITNIDDRPNLDSYFNALFLTGYTKKLSNGYNFSGINFTYDQEAYATYTSAQLAITNDSRYYKARSVNVTESGKGAVSASHQAAFPGQVVTLSQKEAAGYEFDHYVVNGSAISGNTFKMPATVTTVEAVYKKIDYPITVNCSDHGSATVTPEKGGVGTVITVNAVPDPGYYTKSIVVEGRSISGKTFEMYAKPVTVEVEFDQIAQAAVGETLTDGINNYKITNNAMDGTGTAAFAGSANQAASVSVPAVVNLKGIPYKVTKIATRAFYKNTSVTSVSIGSNVIVIEGNAFVGCTRLTKITGGARLKSIGSRAVVSCPNLKSFSISSSVLSKIGSYAFYGDKNLKTLNIKKTTKLKKKSVKKSLKGSKIKTVKVKKSKVRKYKRYFTKKNCGRKVKVKK